MMETSTLQQDSFCNGSKDSSMKTLTDTEKDFYNEIKPALNSLVKNPSEEVIAKILAYSKEL